ncbi:hypothetical protein F2Q65_11070 [Thiohalocapsa marina]|uniref:Uncharacterized protein n=1 Tax=Thiohalocapsa marina TaxID=424902 RepID=A0A5M8FQN7_9GAMM|nr:hypothetical protein [Thiohalocapsa marina]KAA6184845.1 hypothetical protein F2Q65_11070 [Thiohalocapsa marina]
MMFPTLIAGGFSLLMTTASDAAVNQAASLNTATESTRQQQTTEVARIDPQTHAFPTDAMAEQFAEYLAWTKQNGLSRLAAFESLQRGEVHESPHLSAEVSLPTAEMTEQFHAYLQWVRKQGLGDFYAFQVTEFD